MDDDSLVTDESFGTEPPMFGVKEMRPRASTVSNILETNFKIKLEEVKKVEEVSPDDYLART